MGLRETINENRRTFTGATIGLIVLMFAVIIWEALPSKPPGPPSKAFFSEDDGNHWFKDDISNVPPYSHNGKTAVRAYVYHWSGGDFVGYLEKYPDKIREQLQAAPPGPARDAILIETPNSSLVKKPGSAYWSKIGTPAGQKISNITNPPNGNAELPDPVNP